ncbi:alpha/beta fold hydrolase [Herbiconiux sp. P16]|uniref:alpha/beta fold hydrolase n=1 Tax=Herbiconiux wuyangfengii TaxID=3342794 RepID=UPI0035B9AE93
MKFDVELAKRSLADDPELALAARYWDATVVLKDDDLSYSIQFENGKVVDFLEGAAESATVTLTTSTENWDKMLEPIPVPFWTEPAAALFYRDGALEIAGDYEQDVQPYYRAIRRLVANLRESLNGGTDGVVKTVPKVEKTFDSIVGRYVYITVDDVQYRVYYEESGTGIPVVCQHTAGSDGRQYRHFLEDEKLQESFRMIAYDLPYHGKSNPPSNKEWWSEEYNLTQDFLLKFVKAFNRALGLERPIFLGCSIGGFLAPDLALAYPGEFRAVISMNGGVFLGAEPEIHVVSGFLNPRVSDGWKGGSQMGVMAPDTPEAYRRETAWYYDQGAPPVFSGDLNYWYFDHDLRGRLGEIDTSKTAVYVVAGDYDQSVREELGDLGAPGLAAGIPGAKYIFVEQGGHFLMCESPEQFKDIIHPILAEIAAS